jgi:hypothetical protein
MNEKKYIEPYRDGIQGETYAEEGVFTSAHPRHVSASDQEVFGNEEGHSIKYRTMTWQMVAVLMIAEIVSNGMLSLPSSSGVVGVSTLSFFFLVIGERNFNHRGVRKQLVLISDNS